MDCFVLGTGGMMPMPRRRLSSVAVRLEGSIYLFDCGEGTQVPYKELHLGQRALSAIFITHRHADHCLGLPGMMMLRAQMPDAEPLTLVGPPGLAQLVEDLRRDLEMYINYEVRVCELPPNKSDQGGLAYEDQLVQVFWQPLDHSMFCLGYRLAERTRPGKFDEAAAEALGICAGPARGQLQRGQSVTLADGRQIWPSQVLGPPRRGRTIAYVTDTAPCAGVEQLLNSVDFAFVEGMFLTEHEAEATEKKHLTVKQATAAAQAAQVARLRLIHLSPRYDQADLARYDAEAASIFPTARAARDGEQISISLPD